jgi:hypothetical protein
MYGLIAFCGYGPACHRAGDSSSRQVNVSVHNIPVYAHNFVAFFGFFLYIIEWWAYWPRKKMGSTPSIHLKKTRCMDFIGSASKILSCSLSKAIFVPSKLISRCRF